MRKATRFAKLCSVLAVLAILALPAMAWPPGGNGNGNGNGGGGNDGDGDSGSAGPSTFYVRYDNGGGWQRLQEYATGEAYDQDEAFLGRVYFGGSQPSQLVYGPDPAYDRWFCRPGFTQNLLVAQTLADGTVEYLYGLLASEVVVSRSLPNSSYQDNINVQITNLLEDGLLIHGDSTVQWSNGEDAFLSVMAEDISQFTIKRGVFFDGNEYDYIDLADAARTPPKLYRLHISGADIEAGIEIDPETLEWSLPNRFGREVAEEISLIEAPVPIGGGWRDIRVAHDWSPDGTALAYRDLQDGNVYLLTGLDTGTPTEYLVWSDISAGTSPDYFDVDWSPSSVLGDRLVFNGNTASGTGICVTPIDLMNSAAPVGPTTLVMAEDDKGWGHYFLKPCWSPDGTIVAAAVYQVDNRGDRVLEGSRQFDLLTGRQSNILNNLWLRFWCRNTTYTGP